MNNNTYFRDPNTGALINKNSNGYAARLAAKARHSKIEEQASEINTLKEQLAALQASVNALTSSE